MLLQKVHVSVIFYKKINVYFKTCFEPFRAGNEHFFIFIFILVPTPPRPQVKGDRELRIKIQRP